MRKFLLPILGTMFVIGIATFVWASVIDTPHDIVPGAEPCAFCHTPHMGTGQYPLWNRINDSDPGQYDMYQSSSFDMVGEPTDQPRSPSTLCLVCHNGIASSLVNYPGPCNNNPDAAYDVTVEGCADLGTDLMNDHPVSFDYYYDYDVDKNGFLPAVNISLSLTRARMAIQGQISGTNYFLYGADAFSDQNWFECSTCHSVHHLADPMYEGAGDTQVYFLRADNSRSQMCRDCHILR